MIQSDYTRWTDGDPLLAVTTGVAGLVEVFTVRVDFRANIVDKCVALEASGTETVGIMGAVGVDT